MIPGDKKAERAAKKAKAEAEQEAFLAADRLKKLENKFWSAPYGQARAAKLAGDKYFQVEIALDATTRSTGVVSTIGTTSRKYSGHGRTISDIEAEGWDLVEAGFVFKETGQVSRDKFLSTGQQVNTTGVTVGVYLFRANDDPARTDEVWKVWADRGQG